ncbi:MAG: DUF1553 domain-containing protein [Planctomycetota bacterium]|nr:DUF1553 domain-containing protein [Planctomycetota bacterium]
MLLTLDFGMGRQKVMILLGIGTVIFGALSGIAQDIDPKKLAFFETKIRPVLVQSCYSCHSQQAAAQGELKGGLFLDTRQGLLRGGDTGPAVVLNKPAESLLISALEYDNSEMPPKGQLPGAVIEDFRKWIAMGLPDPRNGELAHGESIDIQQGKEFWAYQPLQVGEIPSFRRANGPIDSFVLRKLQQEGLQQGEVATRRVLIRRLYFDLTGLPPSVAAQQQFVNAPEPDAYRRLVEKLLASPQFGERWGRHWLDVVRYAESITLRGFLLPEAWRYRDYVISSFNQDRSYGEFLRQQIAGDLLPAANYQERQQHLIATTFLTLGNTNLEDQDKDKLRMDVVDEQLSTIGRGFLGQTIGCARCHDHKFDPIPTVDYYALAGILRNTKTLNHANVSKWIEAPLPQSPEIEANWRRHAKQVAGLKQQIAALKKKRPSSKTLLSKNLPGVVVDEEQAQLTGKWQRSMFTKNYIDKGYQHDLNQAKGKKRALFKASLPNAGTYEVRLAYTPGSNRARKVPVTVFHADGQTSVKVDQTKSPPLLGRFVSLGRFSFTKESAARVLVETKETTGHVIIDAVQFLPIDQVESPQADRETKRAASAEAEAQKSKSQLAALEQQLKKLNAVAPQQQLYMAVQEEKEIDDTAVHVRGDVHNLGKRVPRGFLRVLPIPGVGEFSKQESGRRQLGDWIADPANPLTSRVMANRIWYWLIGAGIVRSVDNFGSAGDLPTHPELLDYLARQLQQQWSIKDLVREIVLSRTYQLSSADDGAQLEKDLDNRLLARMNWRRLDAECILDGLLKVSGNLNSELTGSEIRAGTKTDYNYVHRSGRRAVYWPVLRNSVAEVLDVFDFANPSMVVGARDISASASQALFMINSEQVMDLAQQTAALMLRNQKVNDRQRIQLMTATLLGRDATAEEISITLKFLEGQKSPGATRQEKWAQIIQAVFASIDFRYVY